MAILITIFNFEENVLNKLSPSNFLSDKEEYDYYVNQISNFIFTIKWDVLSNKLSKLIEKHKDNLLIKLSD